MSIEIIPPGASAVVSERHHEHGNRHPDNWDLSTEMQRDLNHTRSQAEKEFIEVINQAERNTARLIDEQCDDTASIISSVDSSATAAALAFTVAQKLVSDAATSTVVGFKDAQTTAYQIEGRSDLAAEKNKNDLSVQATTNFNALNVQGNLMQYNILLDSQKNAEECRCINSFTNTISRDGSCSSSGMLL